MAAFLKLRLHGPAQSWRQIPACRGEGPILQQGCWELTFSQGPRLGKVRAEDGLKDAARSLPRHSTVAIVKRGKKPVERIGCERKEPDALNLSERLMASLSNAAIVATIWRNRKSTRLNSSH